MLQLKGGDKTLSISSTRYAAWCAEYSACSVLYEISKANQWLEKHPTRMWKTLAGMERWLERADREAAKNPSAYRMKTKDFLEGPTPASESYWAKRERAQEETSYKSEGKRASDDVAKAHLSNLKAMLG